MCSKDFYSLHYIAAIEKLKEARLWDFEFGMLFMPILQYCMPPPSFKKIEALLINLAKCDINTDWAPASAISKLRNKISPYAQLFEYFDEKNIGTEYPIFYAIQRVSDLKDWPKPIKSMLLIELLENIHDKTCEAGLIDSKELYNDVYMSRDLLIAKYARQYGLKPHAQTLTNIESKDERIHFLEFFGAPRPSRKLSSTFWQDPPHIPFLFKLDDDDEAIQKKNPRGQKEDIEKSGLEPSLLTNKLQQITELNTHSKWLTSNVRTLSDANQLSYASIFSYWEFLLEKRNDNIFKLSLLAFLTGISKKYWENGLQASPPDTECVVLAKDKHQLRYKVSTGSTEFIRDTPSKAVHLALPKAFQFSTNTIKEGLKEETVVRAFNGVNPGPSLRLNNIARAGHVLLRKKIAGETLAFILSGRVPIEFKARSAYLTTSNSRINDIFEKCLKQLAHDVSKYPDRIPLVKSSFKQFLAETSPASTHELGSQLSKPNWNFQSFSIKPYFGNNIDELINRLNNLELYFFWMAQFALSTRALGPETQSTITGDYWLHKDKDSSEYFESKLLLLPDLLTHQKNELIVCRQSFLMKHTLKAKDYSPHFPHKFYEKRRNKIYAYPLFSSQAIKMTQELWGLTPHLNRNNAHRHQTATFAHEHANEVIADTWLGHHIDGWFFDAPEASSGHQTLENLLKLQENWLERMGFHLVENPLP